MFGSSFTMLTVISVSEVTCFPFLSPFGLAVKRFESLKGFYEFPIIIMCERVL